MQSPRERAHLLGCDILAGQRAKIGDEAGKITTIHRNGVGGKPAFHHDMGEKPFDFGLRVHSTPKPPWIVRSLIEALPDTQPYEGTRQYIADVEQEDLAHVRGEPMRIPGSDGQCGVERVGAQRHDGD